MGTPRALALSAIIALATIGGSVAYTEAANESSGVLWQQSAGSAIAFPACGSASASAATCSNGAGATTLQWDMGAVNEWGYVYMTVTGPTGQVIVDQTVSYGVGNGSRALGALAPGTYTYTLTPYYDTCGAPSCVVSDPSGGISSTFTVPNCSPVVPPDTPYVTVSKGELAYQPGQNCIDNGAIAHPGSIICYRMYVNAGGTAQTNLTVRDTLSTGLTLAWKGGGTDTAGDASSNFVSWIQSTVPASGWAGYVDFSAMVNSDYFTTNVSNRVCNTAEAGTAQVGYQNSNQVCNTVGPNNPTGLVASCDASGTATLTYYLAPGTSAVYPRYWSDSGTCASGWSLWSDGHTCYINGYGSSTITIPGLVPGQTYSTWVHAGEPVDWSQPSTSTTFTCPVPPKPAEPTLQASCTGTAGSMSWNAVSGATSYYPILYVPIGDSCPVYWTDGGTSTQWQNRECHVPGWTGTSITMGLIAGHSYAAYVGAVNSSGQTNSGPKYFSCPVPVDLVAWGPWLSGNTTGSSIQAYTTDSLTLNGTSAATASRVNTSYPGYFGLSGRTSTGTLVGRDYPTSIAPTFPSYDAPSAYYYRSPVSAFVGKLAAGSYTAHWCTDQDDLSPGGMIPESNEGNNCAPLFNFTVVEPPPAAPTLQASCTGTAGSMSWNAVSGATSYYPILYVPIADTCPVYWTDGGTSTQWQNRECHVSGWTGTSITMGLIAGHSYAAYVGAVNSSGQTNSQPKYFSCPVPSLPDLTADTMPNTTATLGTPKSFSTTIRNGGGAGTGASFYNVMQLDTDADHASGNEQMLGLTSPEPMPALAANASALASLSHTFTAAGTYYVRVCADYDTSWASRIFESNEGNNCGGGWTTVTVTNNPTKPDLTAGSVSPTSATLNAATSLSGVVTNGGSASTGAGFTDIFEINYGSIPATFAEIDAIRTYSSATLAAGASNTASASYTFATAGDWYVRLCADADATGNAGTIPESNEDNNCGSTWTKVTVSGPGDPSLTCSADHSGTVPVGTTVKYTAVPANGAAAPYTFRDALSNVLQQGSSLTYTKTYNTTGTYAVSVGASNVPGTAACGGPITVGTGGSCNTLAADIWANPTHLPGSSGTTVVSWSADGVQSSCTVTKNGTQIDTVTNACNSAQTDSATETISQQTKYCISCDGATEGQAGYDCVVVDVGSGFIHF